MIDKFRKLVAVAEAMVAEWHEMSLGVEGMNVHVEYNQGFVRLGMVREYAVYHPDENQYMPEYGVDYKNYYYDWIDSEWIQRQPKLLSTFLIEAEEPLPF